MKEVLKVLRDLRIETSERNNYSQSYAFGYTDAISDAIQAVKKMNYIPCCTSEAEQLCDGLHNTDFMGKCFKCGEQVFVREDKKA